MKNKKQARCKKCGDKIEGDKFSVCGGCASEYVSDSLSSEADAMDMSVEDLEIAHNI